MVRLTRIYTRTGDAGTTRLADNSIVHKSDPLIEAIGCVQEAGAAVGLARVAVQTPPVPDAAPQLTALLQLLANQLFDLGADLSTPLAEEYSYPPVRITQADIDFLEAQCDEANAQLPALTSFILPGGGPTATQLHMATAITRRAERAAWRAAEVRGLDTPGGLSSVALRYLNRLADLFFILARLSSAPIQETLWHPAAPSA